MASDQIWGTIKFSFCVDEAEMGVPPGDKPLNPKQIAKICERVEEAVSGCIPQSSRIYIDGEDKPGVDVGLVGSGGFGAAELLVSVDGVTYKLSARVDHDD